MNETIHLVQPNQKGKIKFNTYELSGSTINKTWGLVGGKTQTKLSTYKEKNKGKKNAVTSEQSAKAELDKVVNKKIDEGYVITESLEELPEFNDPFKFDLDNIPTSFCCSKPTKTVTENYIDKLIALGSGRCFVKYNGGCHYIVVTKNDEVKIFTRRWHDHTAKYPHIVEAILVDSSIPRESLLIVELCIDPLLNLPHMVAQKRLSEISKTDVSDGECKPSQEASIALQQEFPVRVAVFGFLYCNGEKVWDLPYSRNIDVIKRAVSPLDKKEVLFYPQEVKVASGAKLIALARKYKKEIEGFVFWDTSKSMEVTMNGKPLRRACYKVKAKQEMDVIAYHGFEGKVPGEYGSLKIGMHDKDGNFIGMGTVGGLKDKEKKPSYWDFPCVIEVEFDNRYPDTGMLQFPNFVKKHEDKLPEEVELFSLVQ